MNKQFQAILLICLIGLTYVADAATAITVVPASKKVLTDATTAVPADTDGTLPADLDNEANDDYEVFKFVPENDKVDDVMAELYKAVTTANPKLKEELAGPLNDILKGICWAARNIYDQKKAAAGKKVATTAKMLADTAVAAKDTNPSDFGFCKTFFADFETAQAMKMLKAEKRNRHIMKVLNIQKNLWFSFADAWTKFTNKLKAIIEAAKKAADKKVEEKATVNKSADAPSTHTPVALADDHLPSIISHDLEALRVGDPGKHLQPVPSRKTKVRARLIRH